MELKLDKNKVYAIALEGGGAKGAYQVGAWQALEEAGIRYNAVSGSSVGALNGALMCMGDIDRAEQLWSNLRFSDVVSLEDEAEKEIVSLLRGETELSRLPALLSHMKDIIKNKGLDVSPLRAWVREIVDCNRIRTSPVGLYVTTVSLTDRKGMDIKLNTLDDAAMCDMLLASAYHPSFRQEKLGGKNYADGGFLDSLPISVLVEQGYKDIIAIALPGVAPSRPYKLPDDGSLTMIETKADLGSPLDFDGEHARKNMRIGYLDAKRVLYGLYGEDYYIDRTLSERQALELLIDRCYEGGSLRKFVELELPLQALKSGVFTGDYYDLLIAVTERRAEEKAIDPMRIYTDTEFAELCL